MIDKIKSFLEGNLLVTMMLAGLAVILLCYVVSRIYLKFSYNNKVQTKFKKLNVVIRGVQLTDDREKFLADLNSEVKKKNKTFSPLWDSFLKEDEAVASNVFADAKLMPKKHHFINLFLVSSIFLCFAAVISLAIIQGFDFRTREATFLLILAPTLIISLSVLLNLSYNSVKTKIEKNFLMHYDFFVENIDEALKGFVKNDFYCSNGEKPKAEKDDDVNILSYEDYEKTQADSELSSADREHLQELAQAKVAQNRTEELMDRIEELDTIEDDEIPIEEVQEIKTEDQTLREELLEELKNYSLNKSDATGLIKQAEQIEKISNEKEEDVDASLKELISAKKKNLARASKKQPSSQKETSSKKATPKVKIERKKSVSDALGQLLKVSKNANVKINNKRK